MRWFGANEDVTRASEPRMRSMQARIAIVAILLAAASAIVSSDDPQ
jgi:hypothetical protein